MSEIVHWVGIVNIRTDRLPTYYNSMRQGKGFGNQLESTVYDESPM
jgi:hypothetical protein